jgi:phosphoglycerate dehydrogenase-like enzyme
MTFDRLSVAICQPLTQAQVDRMATAEPRLDITFRPDLLPPLQEPGDINGDLSWRRDAAQEAEFQKLFSETQVLYGLPNSSPNGLRKAVAANHNLVWVHTLIAGGGGLVKQANLDPADLDRIIFTTAAGAHIGPLAEYAVWGVLCGAKDLPGLQAAQRAHIWEPRHAVHQISEMTIAVVGLGRIGRLVCQRFVELGATVLGVNRSIKDVPGVEVHQDADLIDVCSRADAIVNCLPDAVGTEKLISREALAALHHGATIVSLGRGTCVDQEAMTEFLVSGQLGFAALDVFEHEPLPTDSPLWDLPNVLISPHTIAVSTHESDRVLDIFLQNATALLDGQPMPNLMNKQLFY